MPATMRICVRIGPYSVPSFYATAGHALSFNRFAAVLPFIQTEFSAQATGEHDGPMDASFSSSSALSAGPAPCYKQERGPDSGRSRTEPKRRKAMRKMWLALAVLMLVCPVAGAQTSGQPQLPPANANDAKLTDVLNAWEKAMTGV